MIVSNQFLTEITQNDKEVKIGPYRLKGIIVEGYSGFSLSKNGFSTTVKLCCYNNTSKETLKKWLIQEGQDPLYVKSFIQRSYYAEEVLDFLFNKYNEHFWNEEGKITEKTKAELIRRIVAPTRGHSYSNILLLEALKRGFVIHPELQRQLKKFKTYITESDKPFYYIQTIMFSQLVNDQLIYVPPGIPLTSLGYIQIVPPTSEGHSYKIGFIDRFAKIVEYEGETYWSYELLSCYECGKKGPRHIFHKNRCKTCLKVDPQLLVIRNYNEKAPNFLKLKLGKYSKSLFTKPLFFGIELEYTTTDIEEALYKTVKMLSDHAICKHDASIGITGFEIVTTPATFDKQVEAFKPFFDNFPKEFQPTTCCGMHVHVSREPLSMLTQGKIVEFMNREDNGQFIRLIAGRDFNTYSKQDNKRTLSFPFTTRQAERYNTVNTNNEHTLEFRIFSVPETWEDFITKLEFVNALVAYSAPCQTKATTLKEATYYQEFIKYIKENTKRFPYFYEFLIENMPTVIPKKKKALKKYSNISHIELSKQTLI